MASAKQRKAAKINIKKAQAALRKKKRASKSTERSVTKVAKKKGGGGGRQVHLIPDLLIVGGISLPFFEEGTGYNSPYYGVKNIPKGYSVHATASNFAQSYSDITHLKDAAVLVGAGLVAKWAGKKVGLNRVGTKDVKVM